MRSKSLSQEPVCFQRSKTSPSHNKATCVSWNRYVLVWTGQNRIDLDLSWWIKIITFEKIEIAEHKLPMYQPKGAMVQMQQLMAWRFDPSRVFLEG